MAYPEDPGYVWHSDTSKAAALSLLPNKFWSRRKRRIWNYVDRHSGRNSGPIVDEVQEALGLSHQAASGTCSAMVAAGILHYSKWQSKTRNGYWANELRIGRRIWIKSKKKAARIKPRWNRDYQKILEYIRDQEPFGATADEVEVDLKLTHQHASVKCGYMLRYFKCVYDTEKRRKTRSRRAARVLRPEIGA